MSVATRPSISTIGNRIDALTAAPPVAADAEELLALHRQGADKDPSFNACRETCRELAYHYNLLKQQPDHADSAQRALMMALVARHLHLFISGKMETGQLGEFCCSSRPLREGVDSGTQAQ